MNTKNITITVISSLIVLMIFSLILTGTYSLYSGESISSNKNEFTTGALSITANHKSSVISINNILPIPDSEGIKTNPYIFTITNTGTIDYNFSVKLVATGVNNYSSNYLKIKVDNDNITTLQSTGGIIKSNITLPAGESIDISIRIWLDEYTPNTEIGKSFESEIRINGESVPKSKPYSCAKGTLIQDSNLGYVCLINSWTNDSSYNSETGMCTIIVNNAVSNYECPYHYINGKPTCPPGTYPSDFGYSGAGCYKTVYVEELQQCECEWTCGNYSVYSGSGKNMKCYVKASNS